jgi:lipoyl(octanoyl) transferase
MSQRALYRRITATLPAWPRMLPMQSTGQQRGLTGVWSRGEKVAAIGIKLNRSVVSHGFALNLTSDLQYFNGIVPCGHVDKRPTSVEALTGRRIDTFTAARDYTTHFSEVFGVRAEWASPESLLPAARR